MCTNIASGQNSWSVKVCRRLVIHQIQSVRCYNKLVTDLRRFISSEEREVWLTHSSDTNTNTFEQIPLGGEREVRLTHLASST